MGNNYFASRDDGVLMRRLLGQVGGVAFSSAIFQWNLDVELHARINGPNAEEVCNES